MNRKVKSEMLESEFQELTRLRKDNAEMRRLLGKLDTENYRGSNGEWAKYAVFTDDDIRSLCELTGRDIPKELSP